MMEIVFRVNLFYSPSFVLSILAFVCFLSYFIFPFFIKKMCKQEAVQTTFYVLIRNKYRGIRR